MRILSLKSHASLLGIVLLSRILLLIVGWATHSGLTLCHWDCIHYVELSQSYSLSSPWFPAWPLLNGFMRPMLAWMSLETQLVVVSNLLFLGGIGFLIRFAEQVRLFPNRMGLVVFILGFSFYPWNLQMSFGYSEALFFFYFAAALWLMSEERWLWAAAMIGLGGVTRHHGLWLGAVWGVWMIAQWRKKTFPFRTLLLSGLVAALPLAGYLFLQGWLAGDPLAFVHAQENAGRSFSLLRLAKVHLPSFQLVYGLLVLSWVATFWGLRHRHPWMRFFGMFSFCVTLFPLLVGADSAPYFSYKRFLGTNLALFAFLATYLARYRWASGLFLLGNASYGVLLVCKFVRDLWADG